jgi:long-chain acyl-CoA synthetase
MSRTIFLTGATGFVGHNLFSRILLENPRTELILLVRSRSQGEAEQRIKELFVSYTQEIDYNQVKDRITIVRGDITLKKLGMAKYQYAHLAKKITHIIHCAATTKFQLPLEKARLINYQGTKNVMRFAKYIQKIGKLQRVAHLSTAYVSGNRSGNIYEHDLGFGQRFSNSYEQAKYESEHYVRGLMDELPITIFRPSIIVGDSKTGKTTCFNVLYYPLQLIYKRKLPILSGFKSVTLDVVSVDFVCDAINHILLKSKVGIGETYHLTAGVENEMTAGEIIGKAISYFNQRRSKRKIHSVKFISPRLLQMIFKYLPLQLGKVKNIIETYEPYICVKRTFDNANTRSVLEKTDIKPYPLKIYYNTLLAYCIKTDWGKQLSYNVY